MLNPKLEEALNKQLGAEYFSSYLYLSMAAHFEDTAMPGMAAWMRIQSQEEMMHAMKFYDFILDRNGRVTLAQIEAPQTHWSSPAEAFDDAYGHEQKITGLIDALVDLAVAEKDHATETFLQWFVTEQVEEEATVSTIVDQLRMVGDNGVALYMIDGQLGQRAAPAAPAGQ